MAGWVNLAFDLPPPPIRRQLYHVFIWLERVGVGELVLECLGAGAGFIMSLFISLAAWELGDLN